MMTDKCEASEPKLFRPMIEVIKDDFDFTVKWDETAYTHLSDGMLSLLRGITSRPPRVPPPRTPRIGQDIQSPIEGARGSHRRSLSAGQVPASSAFTDPKVRGGVVHPKVAELGDAQTPLPPFEKQRCGSEYSNSTSETPGHGPKPGEPDGNEDERLKPSEGGVERGKGHVSADIALSDIRAAVKINIASEKLRERAVESAENELAWVMRGALLKRQFNGRHRDFLDRLCRATVTSKQQRKTGTTNTRNAEGGEGCDVIAREGDGITREEVLQQSQSSLTEVTMVPEACENVTDPITEFIISTLGDNWVSAYYLTSLFEFILTEIMADVFQIAEVENGQQVGSESEHLIDANLISKVLIECQLEDN
eukprot:GHVN01015743.1.p1 GENE.GHVN01015743.1~~GHVN01015743.1.p1  ORF type:complete len:380 (+),score=89.90 GHVN01015743.1:44-1141(+)